MIYLDNAATTPLRPEVIEVIDRQLRQTFGNPSSGYRLGKEAKQTIRLARQELAEILNVEAKEIYFTSGATEANNWAIYSQATTSRELGYGDHIVVTSIEHSAVMKTIEKLEDNSFTYSLIYPNDQGNYTADQFIEASHSQTIGWVAMTVNNELGTILPVKELAIEARERGFWFHTDAVQGMGKISLNFGELPATSFVASAHKFNGPKGIGFLVYRPNDISMNLRPLLVGGGQENGMRSGTENTPYIVGMVEALKMATSELEKYLVHYQRLANYLFTQLDIAGIDYKLNGEKVDKVNHIHNIWFKGFKASQLMILLDLAGIYISAGSACSAGSITPSRVLQSYYPNQEERWSESVRISFGPDTREKDIDELIRVIENEIKRREKNGI